MAPADAGSGAAVPAAAAVGTAPATGAKAAELKPPPPEKPTERRRRSWIILSFWVIVLFLGIPFWWKTTSIYRAELPVDDMLRWADGKVR
jgi:phosphatidylinositol glycan class S